MDPLEIRIIAYAVLGLGVISATAWATHKLDDARYASLQAEYSQYQATTQANDALAQKTARDALQLAVDTHQKAEDNNAKTIASLQSQVDGARTDAEFARKLLASAAAAAAPGTAGHPAAQTNGGSTANGAPTAPGDRPPTTLLGDVTAAAAECRDAIQRFTALQIELRPQLTDVKIQDREYRPTLTGMLYCPSVLPPLARACRSPQTVDDFFRGYLPPLADAR